MSPKVRDDPVVWIANGANKEEITWTAENIWSLPRPARIGRSEQLPSAVL
jgi:hypothetical protein